MHDTYLIYDQFNFLQQLGSQIVAMIQIPDATKVDYPKIRKIVSEALRPLEAKEMPEAEKVDLSPVLSSLGGLRKLVEDYYQEEEDEEPEKPIDFSPVLLAIGQAEKHIHDSIDSLPQPTPQIDLSPILEAIKKMDTEEATESLAKLSQAVSELNTKFGSSIPTLSKNLTEILAEIKDMNYSLSAQKGQQLPKTTAPNTTLNSFGVPIKR